MFIFTLFNKSSRANITDLVAYKSGFLCMYMKKHPDTLVAYVNFFGQVEGILLIAEMSSIDSKGMTLMYKLKSGQLNMTQISFDPPLLGYEEVKLRLLGIKA
ncbi:hypothetical protein DFJ58DRAFT_670038 [Suillus subalutaceus]|uniref:uncharacterized protein n=1 Tax=Suillus subalutaceus TaxID=48586 RepID=UPI001B87DC5B|nr:uncharacterized protein DFJ58DRAFT_670038 [Suillus subalutaceus]KAG1836047.1 hypothetical protein DFJ58DRAFT_670038 [Suillus subalutaceus]